MPLVADPPSPTASPVATPSATPKRRGWVKWTALVSGVLAVYLAGESAAILATSHARATGTADAAIVLGASAWKGTPSKVLASRVDEAVRLYKAGQVKKVIFTGGSAKGDPSSEAEAARAYALSKGLPSGAALVETRSTSTYENLLYTLPIARDKGYRTVFLVSDGLHLHRAEVMAAGLGLNARPAPCQSLFRSAGIKARFASHELVELVKFRLSSPFLPKG